MVFGVQKVGFCIAKVWFLFFKRVFFVLQYIIPHPRNTPKMASQYIVPRPRTPTKWRCVGAIWHIIFTYFWVLPTFLYLTNFAFAK